MNEDKINMLYYDVSGRFTAKSDFCRHFSHSCWNSMKE